MISASGPCRHDADVALENYAAPQEDSEAKPMTDGSVSAAASPVQTDPNAQLTIRALVSTKEAGIIIGKGGANVADLRDKTGVKAGVSKVVQGVHDRVLSVSGTLEGVSQVRATSGALVASPTLIQGPSTDCQFTHKRCPDHHH